MPPGLAIQQLDLDAALVAKWLAEDASFQHRVEQVQNFLSENVAAALYKAALEGSVSAQTFYLKHRPPAGWPVPENHPLSTSTDEMSDDESRAQFLRDAPLLLAQLAAQGLGNAGDGQPGSVPAAADDSR